MQVSAFTLIFRDLPLCEALEAVKTSFDMSETTLEPAASLWLKHEDAPVLDPCDRPAVESVRRTFEEAGVRVGAVFFAHDYPSDERTLEEAKRKVDAAVLLGAEESLLLCPWPYRGGLGKFVPPEEYYRSVLEFVRWIIPLADYAAGQGHRLSFKPHCGLVSDARSGWEFAARFDHPGIRLSYDAANVRFYEGVDPLSGLEVAAPFISSVILKDHSGKRWEPVFPDPGRGEVDHAGVMKVLRSAGFDGPVVIEKVQGDTREEKVSHLAQALRFAERLTRNT